MPGEVFAAGSSTHSHHQADIVGWSESHTRGEKLLYWLNNVCSAAMEVLGVYQDNMEPDTLNII